MPRSSRTSFQTFSILLFIPMMFMATAGRSMLVAEEAGVEPSPVEADMHEFMEYVFEPAYKRLKASMAKAPADNKAWKSIKGDSLALAEAANLLLIRGPEEHRADWGKLSVAVRSDGAAFYQAAKKRDFAAATKSYRAMIRNCNQCHNKFADGEHQLTP